MELAEVMDKLTGETDIRSGAGAMGCLTNGLLNRAEAYGLRLRLTLDSGIVFAFAPHISDQKYWS
jgi:non-canonical (house-cleaning) NTP pyrophosphatase